MGRCLARDLQDYRLTSLPFPLVLRVSALVPAKDVERAGARLSIQTYWWLSVFGLDAFLDVFHSKKLPRALGG
jgi:hypothetical protein